MAAAQAAENHGDEWGLTWYLQWGIYKLIPIRTHSENSQAAAEALSLMTSSKEHHPNRHKNSHKLCNEMGHFILSLLEIQWKLRQQHD